MYFKSEKVFVSLHSWKIMGLGPCIVLNIPEKIFSGDLTLGGWMYFDLISWVYSWTIHRLKSRILEGNPKYISSLCLRGLVSIIIQEWTDTRTFSYTYLHCQCNLLDEPKDLDTAHNTMNCQFWLTANHANLHAQLKPTRVSYWLATTRRLFFLLFFLREQAASVNLLNPLLFSVLSF